MSEPTTFDYQRPRGADFKLIQRAIRHGWPIPQATRTSLAEFCRRAKLDNRTDRIARLAGETLDMLAHSIEQTIGNLPEQVPATRSPTGHVFADKTSSPTNHAVS